LLINAVIQGSVEALPETWHNKNKISRIIHFVAQTTIISSCFPKYKAKKEKAIPKYC